MSKEADGESTKKKKGGCLKVALIILAIIVVIGVILFLYLRNEYKKYEKENSSKQVSIIGEEIPDFTVETIDGEKVTLSELSASHEVTVLNVFTSWCGPCKREFPAMEAVYKKYPDKVAILALSDDEDDTFDVLKDYKKENKLSFMIGRDEGKTDSLPTPGYPTTFIIDRNGKVVFCQSGTIPDEADVEKLYTSFMGDDYDGSPVFMYTAMVGTKKEAIEGAVVKFTSDDGDTQEATTNADGQALIMVNSPAKYTVTVESLPDGKNVKGKEDTVGPESGLAVIYVD